MHNRGFTLLELVIIIAVLGVLIAVIVPSLARFRQQQALQNSANALVGVLGDARTKTLAAVNDTSYGIKLEASQVTLYTGTTYSSGATSNEVYTFESPVTASWNLDTAGSTISFARLTGAASAHGTIVLSIPSGATKTITITALGTITKQ